MIARHWKGIAKSEFARAYTEHLMEETFPALNKLHGFISASILKRTVTNGVEFLIVTEWDSLLSIKAFSGEDTEIAVVPQTVQEMMVEYDQRAIHYEVAHEFK
jgi:heme-degrading monooxygenase HmoA